MGRPKAVARPLNPLVRIALSDAEMERLRAMSVKRHRPLSVLLADTVRQVLLVRGQS